MENKKAILKLYDDYTETAPRTTKQYMQASNQFLDSIERFRDKLSNRNKKQLDKIMDLAFKMNTEDNKQTFVYAYTLGVRLTTDALYEEREN